ncbi:MAG: hypothetical protein AB1393_01060 [Candidatus Edwardsbacteria bacterium]
MKRKRLHNSYDCGDFKLDYSDNRLHPFPLRKRSEREKGRGRRNRFLIVVINALFLFWPGLLLSQTKTALTTTQPTPLQPVPEDSLFKREKFEFRIEGRRDPFVSLVTKKGEGTGEVNIESLDVGNLKLVGIITGSSGRLGVFKDTQGVGYILKAGDRVIGGRVVEVLEDAVVFEQGEPGKMARFTVRLTPSKK